MEILKNSWTPALWGEPLLKLKATKWAWACLPVLCLRCKVLMALTPVLPKSFGVLLVRMTFWASAEPFTVLWMNLRVVAQSLWLLSAFNFLGVLVLIPGLSSTSRPQSCTTTLLAWVALRRSWRSSCRLLQSRCAQAGPTSSSCSR